MQAYEAALDIMAVLKRSTAEQHVAVERLMPFFEATFSLEEYVRVVGVFLGFFEPLERKLAAVDGWDGVDIDLTRRRRAHLLRADLRALGTSEAEIAGLPRCEDLPAVTDCFDGLGCLYVLEGSTLGGQVIARELTKRFGRDQSSGVSFFSNNGVNVGEAWKEFCAAVRAHVKDPGEEAATVNAAKEAFACFAKWIEENRQDAA